MSELAYQSSHIIRLSAHDQVMLFKIACKMREAGLSEEFIADSVKAGLEFEGIADLICMWDKESDVAEQNEIIADIQELLNDCEQAKKEELPYIKFNDLDSISKDIRRFKDSLLEIVDQQGGISLLANKTGIPQPSLSRFFNTNSMPHRATLLKIAKALDLDGIQIATKWQK